jgi:hypothetical protein
MGQMARHRAEWHSSSRLEEVDQYSQFPPVRVHHLCLHIHSLRLGIAARVWQSGGAELQGQEVVRGTT